MKHIMIFMALGLLTACSGIQSKLGLGKTKPDAFVVVSRAPLEMPPEYNTLPTPVEGAPRPQEASTNATARAVVLGNGASGATTATSGENALLSAAGAGAADPNVRGIVDAEAGITADKNKSSVEKLTGLKIGGGGKDPEALDPIEESHRLRGGK